MNIDIGKQPSYQEEEPEYSKTVRVFETLKDGTKGQQLLIRRYRHAVTRDEVRYGGVNSLVKDFEDNGFIVEVEDH